MRMEKETEDFSVDYGFISKFIQDDEDKEKRESNENFLFKYLQTKNTGEIEVFSSVGEGQDNSQSLNSFKGRFKENTGFEEEPQESFETIQSESPVTEAKKEFIKHLQEDSLTIDACEKLNHD